MGWLIANLHVIAGLGLLLVLSSFVRLRLAKPRWSLLVLGLVLLVVTAAGVTQVIRGTPGQEETVDQQIPGLPDEEVPDSPVERLRLAWNSEAAANWPAAETLAEISDASYLPPVDAAKRFQELGFPEFMAVVQESMIGYVITGQDVTVVVFRGTDFAEFSDWVANLELTQTETPAGPIHKGFYQAYLSMSDQIRQILNDRNTEHLWVTGHSLGGAIALVCAYDLIEGEQRSMDGVITFGQPMVVRQPLAAHLDAMLLGRYARFVNGADIVPRIPPRYVPCGSLVWFTADGIKRSKPKSPFSQVSGANQLPQQAAAADVAEIVPLSAEEFQQLQSEMRADAEFMRQLPEGVMLSRQSPLLDDHSMWVYREKVHQLLTGPPTAEAPDASIPAAPPEL